MKTRFLGIALALFFVTLNVNAQQAKPITCELSKVTKIEKLPLSSLVQNCTFIQFEDSDNAFFKLWFTTVTDKYIGVSQHGQSPFKLFDRKGKFLCNVGSVGQGPGEYTTLYDQVIDEKAGLIYLAPFTGKKIGVYNLSGKLVREIVSPLDLNKPRMSVSNGILSVVHMPFKGDKAMAIQFDAKGNVIKQLAPPQQFITGSFDGEMFNSRNTQALDFQHTNCDTLFHYDVKENKIVPVYTVSTGSTDSFKQYIELNNRFITNIFGKAIISTDKTTKASSKIEIVNDYYGGINVPVNVVTFRNGWFVYNVEPGQLSEAIEKRMKESSCTAQDKQKLKKLLSSIDEDGNNVVFIGKLK